MWLYSVSFEVLGQVFSHTFRDADAAAQFVSIPSGVWISFKSEYRHA